MKREKKVEFVEKFHDKLLKARAIVLTDYRGLSVPEINKLRNELKEKRVEYRVINNRLLNLASKDTDFEGLTNYLVGPTAVALFYDDPVEPVKVLMDFKKDNSKLEIKAGMLMGKFISSEDVKLLSELPPKEVIIGKLLFILSNAQYRLVNALNGPIREFIYILKQKGGLS